MTLRLWMSHINKVNKTLLWDQDTVTVRMILALASLLWSINAINHPEAFGQPAYSALRAFGSIYVTYKVWSALFFLHFFASTWRIYDPVERKTWALVVNAYGLFIWLLVTISMNCAVGYVAVGTSVEWSLCMFASWALLRTGLRKETVTL